MRLRRLLRPINWKYALGEIAIVAVGILIALAINNWDERRDERTVEIETLRELRASQATDLESLASYVSYHKASGRSAELLLAYVERDLAYHDSLDAHFGTVITGTVFTPNTAAYETLKSRGLRTITDDSLRLATAHLYDVTYERFEKMDGMSIRLFEDKLQPLFVRHFRDFRRWGSATPRHPEALLNDPELRGVLEMLLFYRGFMTRQYESAAEQVESLMDAIDREIHGVGSAGRAMPHTSFVTRSSRAG